MVLEMRHIPQHCLLQIELWITIIHWIIVFSLRSKPLKVIYHCAGTINMEIPFVAVAVVFCDRVYQHHSVVIALVYSPFSRYFQGYTRAHTPIIYVLVGIYHLFLVFLLFSDTLFIHVLIKIFQSEFYFCIYYTVRVAIQ